MVSIRTLLQKRDGSIPEKHALLTIQEIMQNSKVMQLGKYEAIDGLEKKFDVFVKGGGAYWVDETQKIPTTKSEWKTGAFGRFLVYGGMDM